MRIHRAGGRASGSGRGPRVAGEGSLSPSIAVVIAIATSCAFARGPHVHSLAHILSVCRMGSGYSGSATPAFVSHKDSNGY